MPQKSDAPKVPFMAKETPSTGVKYYRSLYHRNGFFQKNPLATVTRSLLGRSDTTVKKAAGTL